jgi:hypothetical protein
VIDQFCVIHKPSLNTAFSNLSNTTFNNILFSSAKLPAMKTNGDERHDSLRRLLEVAREVAQIEGPAALAAALIESEQTVTNWGRRGVSKSGAMKAQARFGVSANWILAGTLPRLMSEGSMPPAVQQLDDDNVQIPQYSAGGSMGSGLILEENPPGLIKGWNVNTEWLRLNVPHHTGVHNLCIVTGFGPSMKPLFHPGDPLLMDRGVKTVQQEGIFFFRVADHGYIKQLQRIPTEAGTILRAKSLNPTYDPFDISSKMDFECFGKILTVWRSEQV